MSRTLHVTVEPCGAACGCTNDVRDFRRWHIVGSREGQRMYSVLTYGSKASAIAAANKAFAASPKGQQRPQPMALPTDGDRIAAAAQARVAAARASR